MEEIMKKRILLFALTAGVLPTGLYAHGKYDPQQATVVSVNKYEAPFNFLGNPTDAPLQSTEYADNVAIQIGCNVYVGRYESAIDYLPNVLAPNHSVDVHLEKHVMYIHVPGDGEVKMGIVSHRQIQNGSCAVSN